MPKTIMIGYLGPDDADMFDGSIEEMKEHIKNNSSTAWFTLNDFVNEFNRGYKSIISDQGYIACKELGE